MAHQTDAILWEALAANLIYYSSEHPSKPPATNLYFQFGRHQKRDVEAFVYSFARTISEHTLRERQKFPEKYEPPDEDDIILDEQTTLKIGPTVKKWRAALDRCYMYDWYTSDPMKSSMQLCQHHEDENRRYTHDTRDCRDSDYDDGFRFNCGCTIPLRERKAHAFLREYRLNRCYKFEAVNKAGYFNVEIVMTLLIHGEMDPILRVCAHPDVHYAKWRQVKSCECMEGDMGWDRLYILALKVYLVLNILYCFPEFRDPVSTRSQTQMDRQLENDYRDTKVFQETLALCTKSTGSEVSKYLHRRFFGVKDDHFRHIFEIKRGMEWPALANAAEARRLRDERFRNRIFSFSDTLKPVPRAPVIGDDEFPFGNVPFDVLLNCEKDAAYFPHAVEVAETYRVLRAVGLPEELVREIIKFAGYDGPQRQLPVAHDPLHPENRDELGKYLNDCWDVMIRCNIFAQALNRRIDWKSEVIYCLRELFCGAQGEKISLQDYKADEGNRRLGIVSPSLIQ